MSSVGVRAAALPVSENPLKKTRSTAAGPRRRAALGEITNCPEAGNAKRPGAKASSKPKPRPAAVVQTASERLPPVSEEPKEQQQQQEEVKEEQQEEQQEEKEQQQEQHLVQAFSAALLSIEDVDEQDADQPQLCSEYVKEIYKYLHQLEEQQSIRSDYMRGYEITPHMRALLIDWLVQVHSRFQLLQETLYVTVAILDRFLQVQPVSRRKLQLAGVTSMLLACKYEETFSPEVGDFAYITDDAFSRSQILEMEQLVLRSLRFQLGRPVPLHFLRRASKVAEADVQRHTLAKYLMELTLLDYSLVHRRPSEVAAAALCLSQLLLHGLPWSPTQQHYSSYDEAHLKPIMQHIAKNLVMVNEGKTKFQAVRTKYSSSRLLKVSLLPQLRSSIVRNMAAAAAASSD